MKCLWLVFLLTQVPAQAAFDQDEVLSGVKTLVTNAIILEARSGNLKNAKFLNRTLLQFQRSKFLWDQDVILERNTKKHKEGQPEPEGSCFNSLGSSEEVGRVTYAYTFGNPKKNDLWVNICPVALKVLNRNQMIYVLIHELAHQQGVKDETMANFVSDRVFTLNSWSDPFRAPTFQALFQHLKAHSPQAEYFYSTLEQTPRIGEIEALYRKTLWNEELKFWSIRPYSEFAHKTSALARQIYFRIGFLQLKKKWYLSQ